MKSAKLLALHTKNVLTCQRALLAYMLTCQLALRAYVRTGEHVLLTYVLTW